MALTESQNTIVYAALAVILLVVLGSSFYSFSQLNTLNAKVAELQNQQSNNNNALIAALTSRVSSLEQKIQELSVSAKLVLFYDSSCTFCNNNFMINNIEQTRSILAKEGIGLSIVDVKDNARGALAAGVRNVPVFFAGTSDLSANPKLIDFFNSLPQINFALQESDQGVTAFPPTTAKVIQNSSCQISGSVQLEEFYSPTCPFCRPVFYGNGTPYNNASKDVRFSELSGDAAQNVSQRFGAKLDLKQRCIGVHTLDENKQVLNLTQSDEALCIEEVGNAAYDENQAVADEYGVPGAPTFVIDCQYITKVREPDKLQEAICDLRPELCTGFDTPTATPSGLTANPTGNATNATG